MRPETLSEFPRFAREFVPVAQEEELLVIHQTFSGALNENYVLGLRGKPERYILRVPRETQEQAKIKLAIQAEYEAIGATGAGISFRLRSLQEQADFMQVAATNELHVVTPLGIKIDSMLLPFIEGLPLDKFLQTDEVLENPEVIEKILAHLTRAHQQSIIFGDRWCTNTIVMPDGDFKEIDFDIQLEGEHSIVTTFEMAQALFHIIHFAGQNRAEIASRLTAFYQRSPDLLAVYDNEMLAELLIGQQRYFSQRYTSQGKLYENLIPPDNEVTALSFFIRNASIPKLSETVPVVVFNL